VIGKSADYNPLKTCSTATLKQVFIFMERPD